MSRECGGYSLPILCIHIVIRLSFTCVVQGWICVLYGVIPYAEQGVQQEHGAGLGERLYSLIHHFDGVQW